MSVTRAAGRGDYPGQVADGPNLALFETWGDCGRGCPTKPQTILPVPIWE
jgi:hypothetical protein